jgi:hypothetical protein
MKKPEKVTCCLIIFTLSPENFFFVVKIDKKEMLKRMFKGFK